MTLAPVFFAAALLLLSFALGCLAGWRFTRWCDYYRRSGGATVTAPGVDLAPAEVAEERLAQQSEVFRNLAPSVRTEVIERLRREAEGLVGGRR